MGDRSAVIWAKLGHAEPQGGWDWGEVRPLLPRPVPSPACRSILRF